jgi:hypothetical protein
MLVSLGAVEGWVKMKSKYSSPAKHNTQTSNAPDVFVAAPAPQTSISDLPG